MLWCELDRGVVTAKPGGVNHCHRKETACASTQAPRRRIGHHRLVDSSPAASHEVMAAIGTDLETFTKRRIPRLNLQVSVVNVQTVTSGVPAECLSTSVRSVPQRSVF